MSISDYSSHFPHHPDLNLARGAKFSEKDEVQVWERFIAGDDESLIFIYRKYADVLYRYGKQFTSRSELISDCIQELFYNLLDKRHNLSQAKSVKGYLMSAFKRKLVRYIKKEGKLELEENAFHIVLSEKSLPISQALGKKELSFIQQRLNNLPVAQREVLLLHYYEGLSYAEIADIMDIKVRSARALTYRALDTLSKELGPYKKSFYIVLLSSILYR
ncbi:RNA polymerase sigma factor [Fulvivirga ligni]|uniref:RNA polymerase sigma factor n=1 Tax=Fulvivirga ligni TaxID=2904246 RepID=UPI001F2E0C97|nr:sigma-70 family RNA polymerase sigma factor [Fulvivirga ligni]UII18950.1 sigma-70 family RNA polymerase sigma factor [Fulvivirga ligni]